MSLKIKKKHTHSKVMQKMINFLYVIGRKKREIILGLKRLLKNFQNSSSSLLGATPSPIACASFCIKSTPLVSTRASSGGAKPSYLKKNKNF
jgi:hypothetical protein